MKFLFKRSKNVPESDETINHNSLSKMIEKGYCYLKSKWAEWMTTQTARLSIRNQLVVFGFFIACTCSYSVYLISMSFSDAHSKRITITSIVKPVKAIESYNATIKKNSSAGQNELNKIIQFWAYIDSLARSPAGKRVLDSIRNKRPGLLDSLARIENYYQSNFKNDYHGK
ncbi:MAG: hypothetical protein B7Y83_01070 [Flavobacteriales bacterium 32-34-25]|nr:MAG: hypothetical protein B7Y83_01070 [Flavobacteriales bacterium 32-34-25]